MFHEEMGHGSLGRGGDAFSTPLSGNNFESADPHGFTPHRIRSQNYAYNGQQDFMRNSNGNLDSRGNPLGREGMIINRTQDNYYQHNGGMNNNNNQRSTNLMVPGQNELPAHL